LAEFFAHTPPAKEFSLTPVLHTPDGRPCYCVPEPPGRIVRDIAHLSISLPDGVKDEDLANDLKYHSSRYAPERFALVNTSAMRAFQGKFRQFTPPVAFFGVGFFI